MRGQDDATRRRPSAQGIGPRREGREGTDGFDCRAGSISPRPRADTPQPRTGSRAAVRFPVGLTTRPPSGLASSSDLGYSFPTGAHGAMSPVSVRTLAATRGRRIPLSADAPASSGVRRRLVERELFENGHHTATVSSTRRRPRRRHAAGQHTAGALPGGGPGHGHRRAAPYTRPRSWRLDHPAATETADQHGPTRRVGRVSCSKDA